MTKHKAENSRFANNDNLFTANNLGGVHVLNILKKVIIWPMLALSLCAVAQDNNELFKSQDGIETRWFTAENPKGAKGAATKGDDGRKRHAAKGILRAGESFIMAESEGRPGVVRRIWFTFPWIHFKEGGLTRKEVLRGMRFDFFWDGAKTPAVSVPAGDFGCQNLGVLYPFKNALFESPEGRNYVCTVPMPFKNSMKLIVTNESGKDIPGFFYEIDCTLGDKLGDDFLYFHSYWKRENPTTEMKDFEFLPEVKGNGRYLGVNFGVVTDPVFCNSWWGEGEVKIYLDGDKELPTLCGTGTEDYIGTSWSMGKFSYDYSGCPFQKDNQFCFYRFHIPDPVFFHGSIRATIQQIGLADPNQFKKMKAAGMQLYHGKNTVNMDKLIEKNLYGIFERHDDWSSCVYFYLDKPENGLPPLAPAKERMK